jgi:hypothetical protein
VAHRALAKSRYSTGSNAERKMKNQDGQLVYERVVCSSLDKSGPIIHKKDCYDRTILERLGDLILTKQFTDDANIQCEFLMDSDT